jgi:hypothetical protein
MPDLELGENMRQLIRRAVSGKRTFRMYSVSHGWLSQIWIEKMIYVEEKELRKEGE